jgi:pre-60S factor REI1
LFVQLFYSKSYTTENAYRSHLNSKRHKENELKAASRPSKASVIEVEDTVPSYTNEEPAHPEPQPQDEADALAQKAASLTVDDDASEDEINQTIDQKIAAARSKLSPTNCLFCPTKSSSLDENLTHMSAAHSFFIPDAEYLVDLTGLIQYLGEKIAVGNVCIYCNGKGREFRSLDAVRKHMVDRSHCKIAYDTQNEKLEISDYYDFTSSYPVELQKKKKRSSRKEKDPEEEEEEEADADGEWEEMDEDDDAEIDEIVDESASEEESESESGSDSEESLPDNPITYGDSHLELVLPSGARIGHRTMKRYYAQSYSRFGSKEDEDPNSGRSIVRQLLADKNSALVPRKGGFGAYGMGTDVIKARNRGEAREAGRHVREFRDQRRREEFKTRVAFNHNNQKHFRWVMCSLSIGDHLADTSPFLSDPLLQ